MNVSEVHSNLVHQVLSAVLFTSTGPLYLLYWYSYKFITFILF